LVGLGSPTYELSAVVLPNEFEKKLLEKELVAAKAKGLQGEDDIEYTKFKITQVDGKTNIEVVELRKFGRKEK